MWLVLIGANEPIVKRAPRNARVIDIRVGNEAVVLQTDYVRISLPELTSDTISGIITEYCSALTIRKFVSFTERYLLLASELNSLHGLAANSMSCVEKLCDKALMRAAIVEKQGVGEVWSRLTATSDMFHVLNNLNFDVIIKPVDGSGSNLITKVVKGEWNTSELATKYASLDSVLIEEYISGNEFSVEALSHEGNHRVLCITEKVVDTQFIETGHIVPAAIHSDVAERITSRVMAFLDTVELWEGPSHTEVIVNDNGVHIVEGHPRTGGDRIVSLVRLTTGIDMISAYLHALCDSPYEPLPIKAPVAQVFFVNFPIGMDYHGLPDMSAFTSKLDEIEVNVSPMAQYQAPTNSGDRHSLFVTYGESYADCQQTAMAVRDTLLSSLHPGENT